MMHQVLYIVQLPNEEGDMHIIQVNEKICNLEREYRDCIKSRRDKIGITRHIIMHQVLYIVQLPNEECDMHII